jgi:3-oxoadipate enol-lactonase
MKCLKFWATKKTSPEYNENIQPRTMKIITSIFIFLIPFHVLCGQDLKSGFIVVGNDSIYYESMGSGNVILMIHDGLLHHEVWDDQFSFFGKNFNAIRYDRRDYGKSSPATDSFTHLEDLETLFKELEIDSAILIACSSGGALAIDFTLKHPQRVNGLVLVGAVVGGFSYTPHMYNRGGHLPENFENDFERSMYYATDDPYEIYSGNTDVKEKAVKMLNDYPRKSFSHQRIVRPEIPAYKRLDEIKAPTLILVGEFDIPDVQAHAGAINAGILNSRRIIIPGSGHLVPMEQPELFNERVMNFIKQQYQ